MRQLSLVVNQSKQDEIIETLQQIPNVTAYTVFHGEGHFVGSISPFESTRDEVVGYVPRIRIDLLLKASDVETVLARVKQCGACHSHSGVYWTTPIDSMGEL